MAKYRDHLPQLDGGLFLTDGGLETTLIYQNGLDLPHFAAFDLLRDVAGRQTIQDYYRRYVEVAAEAGRGFVLESATWRASPDWGEKLGYSAEALTAANRESIEVIAELRQEYEAGGAGGIGALVLSGAIGPRGDGYVAGEVMSEAEAEAYHGLQVAAFAEAGADMISAVTMTNTPEAIGVTRAARAAGMLISVSFTVETDGRLPTGEALGEAIQAVDAATDQGPAYYMINCAHTTHFDATVDTDEAWMGRVRGLRANASRLSHAELDASVELDDGDPAEFARDYHALVRRHPQLTVLGGCCGTDHRHVAEVAAACGAG